MKRLMMSLGKMAIIAMAIIGAILVFPDTHGYYGEFTVKSNMLKTVAGPRLIVVGGSSVAFGFDSTAAEASTGLRTINAGLHAGLGLPFILAHVHPHVRAGDVVVVAPEYQVLSDTHVADDGIVSGALLADVPASLRFATLHDIPAMIRGFPDFALNRLVLSPLLARTGRYVYTVEGFDAHGDEVGHLAARPTKVSFDTVLTADVDRTLAILRSFCEGLHAKGATVIVVFPPVARSVFDANHSVILAIAGALRRELSGYVRGAPEDAVFAEELFFDTPQHLTGSGRTANTRRILETLVPQGG